MPTPACALLLLAAGAAAVLGLWGWRAAAIPGAAAPSLLLAALPVVLALALALVAGRLWHAGELRRVRRDAAQRDRILAGTQDGWWEFDLRSGVALVSGRWRQLHGLAPQARRLRAWWRLLPSSERRRLRTDLQQRLREPGCVHHQAEYRCVRPDGSEAWVLARAFIERGADGSACRISGSATDISAHKRQALALQDALRRTQAILDHMVDGMVTIDVRGSITSLNPAAARIFGYAREELIGQPIHLLMPEPHRSHHEAYVRNYLDGGQPRIIGIGREVDGLRKDGSRFPMQLSVSRIQQQGEPVFIGLVQDISQRRRQEEEIHRLAYYDPLTGLPNRRLLLECLQRALLASGRSGRHGAVMILDLDHFKVLNDTQGHEVGDRLLQQVAERLQACVRAADTVARLGGDEFVVLLEQLSGDVEEAVAQVEGVAAKLLRSLGQGYALGDLQQRSTPSIGIVLFRRDGVSVDELLKMADVAMYQAKAAGRNTTRFYDPAMQQAVAARAALEADMRRSLRERDFLLHYQPQVDRHGELMGVEALLRWQHPQRGMVSPGAFIPLAEELGLITALGSWVLESACRQLVRWSRRPALAHCVVAVNVSAQQLAEPDFVQTVLGALARTGARPDRLKLELTESMLVDDVEAVIAKMLALKAHGVGFALDDFGTGYSSLSYLKRLPLDQLKIDCSFVRDLLGDDNAKVIARTIIGLGHSLGLSVMAEGVETEGQRQVLLQGGCDAFQGYLLGRPAPADAIEQLPPRPAGHAKSHPQVACELVA